jgi:DNA-binding XRE family transcriptional regulator
MKEVIDNKRYNGRRSFKDITAFSQEKARYEVGKKTFLEELCRLFKEIEGQHKNIKAEKAEVQYKSYYPSSFGPSYPTDVPHQLLSRPGSLIDSDIGTKDLKPFNAKINAEVIKILESSYEDQEDLEAFFRRTPQYSIEELEELVDKLPYEDFVSLTYRSLERRGKRPIDLAYDLLNEMARELYEAALGHQDEIEFHLEDRSRVGRELAGLRRALGIKQIELARVLGIFNPTLSEIEHGKYVPSLIKIHEYLEGLRAAKWP